MVFDWLESSKPQNVVQLDVDGVSFGVMGLRFY